MPRCTKKKRKSRQICIGDMRDQITLENRAIRPEEIDFAEDFTTVITVFALIETARGLETFDGANVVNLITHKMWIRFIPGITEETWVLFDDRRFDIMDVESLEERKEFLLLRCKERGQKDIEVNKL